LNNFWQKRGKKVPDKNMNANLEPEDPNEGSQRGGNSANSDPEVAGVEAVETAKLVGELDDLRQTLLRRQADFENYRKRTEKERAEDSKRATARVIEGLIPVIDGFEHALAAQGQKDYENYRRGFELIYKQLVENVTLGNYRARGRNRRTHVPTRICVPRARVAPGDGARSGRSDSRIQEDCELKVVD
jgi:molecular chaperone GrpE (heat shock protein)